MPMHLALTDELAPCESKDDKGGGGGGGMMDSLSCNGMVEMRSRLLVNWQLSP